MIEPREFPLNALVVNEGLLVDLLNTKKSAEWHLATFKGSFNFKYRKRLKALIKKIRNHTKWLVKRKYPKMPKMYYIEIKGGWMFVPWKWNNYGKKVDDGV